MLIYVSSNQMHMLRRLASAIDAQQPQAPHRFVSLQSLAYAGRFRLVLHWQVTVSSNHLYGAETARGQICVVCKKDPYFTRIGAHGPPRACHKLTLVSDTDAFAAYTAHAACSRDCRLQSRPRTREWDTLRSGAATRRPGSHSRLRFTLAKDCCSTSNKEYI